MSRAIHRHRKSGQPVRAGAAGNTAPMHATEYPAPNAAAAPDYEKGQEIPMQPVQQTGNSNQEYYAVPAPPYPQQQAQQKVQMPVEPQMQPSRVQSPVSSAYPSEMGMGSHGEMHEAPSRRY